MKLEKELFKFIYKRHLIWYKRFILKQKQPWTEDKILKKYKIINMYRELDKCTIYIVNKLNNIKNREILLLNIIFYRFFNQYNLYEKFGIKPFSKLDKILKNKLIKNMNKLKEQGKTLFNNAYLISSGVKDQKKHISILDNLSMLNMKKLVKELDQSQTSEESFKVLLQIPMVGPFLACEIWTDLTYFKFFKENWNDNDFVNIGPGAKWGLEILSDRKLSKKELQEKLNHLHKIQKKYLLTINKELNEKLTWKEIAYKKASSNYPFLSITNIEGALCEFRKYWNIKNGKGRRKYFTPRNCLI